MIEIELMRHVTRLALPLTAPFTMCFATLTDIFPD